MAATLAKLLRTFFHTGSQILRQNFSGPSFILVFKTSFSELKNPQPDLSNGLGLRNSEPRCFACYAELRSGPNASAPTGHCSSCHHLRACDFPAGIADHLARKSSRARETHVFGTVLETKWRNRETLAALCDTIGERPAHQISAAGDQRHPRWPPPNSDSVWF